MNLNSRIVTMSSDHKQGATVQAHVDTLDHKTAHAAQPGDKLSHSSHPGDKLLHGSHQDDRIFHNSHQDGRFFPSSEHDAEIIKLLAFPINKITCEVGQVFLCFMVKMWGNEEQKST